MKQKKILLLGGSYFQIPSIKKATELGYYTITCDYSPNNPGHKYAHEYHNISTTNKYSVLQLAKRLKIDGIACYASDPAVTTAAYVAEQLGLPTNPYSSVKILSNKDKYRSFLVKYGFNSPKAKSFDSYKNCLKQISEFSMPVMIKPVDSCGSKGTSKINSSKALNKAVKYALKHSRCQRFIIEEYIEKIGHQLSGDGFVYQGKLVFWCFGNGHFENNLIHPFVPTGPSFPSELPMPLQTKIASEIQRLISLLKMTSSAYNFDIRINKNSQIFLMEVSPRCGGNLTPDVIKYATGIDLAELTIKAAMGESCNNLKPIKANGFWSSYIIHSHKAGKLKRINIHENIKKKILKFDLLYKKNDLVPAFISSSQYIGTLILKYNNLSEMLYLKDNMHKYVEVQLSYD